MQWASNLSPRQWWADLSVTAFTAGFVATLVGFTSSIAIVFSAARGFGATQGEISSWIWALCIGCGLTSLLPSLWMRKPVMIAWSTPGAVVLATAAAGGQFHIADAVGAFIVSSLLIMLSGVSGWFERIMHRIPLAVAAALLAGVLARFSMQAFSAAGAPLWSVARADVCGLGPCAEGGFVTTDGQGLVARVTDGGLTPLQGAPVAWDNHLIALG